MNGARLTKHLRNGLWAEAAKTATDLENVIVTRNRPKAAYNAFYGKNMPGLENIHNFGEVGIVNFGSTNNRMRPKHANRGRPL